MEPRMVRLPRQMIEEIEKIRAERLDQPDVSSIIRELLAEAIEARKKRKSR